MELNAIKKLLNKVNLLLKECSKKSFRFHSSDTFLPQENFCTGLGTERNLKFLEAFIPWVTFDI